MKIRFRSKLNGKEVEVHYRGEVPSPTGPTKPEIVFEQAVIFDEYNQPNIPSRMWWDELPAQVVDEWDKRANEIFWESV